MAIRLIASILLIIFFDKPLKRGRTNPMIWSTDSILSTERVTLLRSLEVAAELVDGRFDAREHLRPGILVEVRYVRERFMDGIEQPAFLRERYGLHPAGCMRKRPGSRRLRAVCALSRGGFRSYRAHRPDSPKALRRS